VLLEALSDAGARDGSVDALRSRRRVDWTDVLLGSRRIRTGLVTEVLDDGRSYFIGLLTRESPTPA